MEKEWYISLNFYPVEKHVKLIQLLLNKASNIYVRKDYFQYIEWKEEWKKEYIDELYEDFVSNSLYLDTKEEAKINQEINEEIIQELKYQEFFNPYMEDIHALKQKLKNNSLKNTERIKTIIKTILRKYMDSIEYVEEEFFLKENKCFTNIPNYSFRAYYSDGILEDWNNTYDWYQIKDEESLNKFLLHSSYEYNLIITENKEDIKEFSYYLNLIESAYDVLAIQCKNKKYEELLLEKFEAEFHETDKITLYDKSMEI